MPSPPSLAPPLYSNGYGDGFGTLYTALHRPSEGSVEYRWPDAAWRQPFDAVEEGVRTFVLRAAPLAAAA